MQPTFFVCTSVVISMMLIKGFPVREICSPQLTVFKEDVSYSSIIIFLTTFSIITYVIVL